MDLKELRESAGLSAEKVAIELGKSVSTIRFWEAGTYTPSLDPEETYTLTTIYNCTLRQLADAFKETQNKRGKNASS